MALQRADTNLAIENFNFQSLLIRCRGKKIKKISTQPGIKQWERKENRMELCVRLWQDNRMKYDS